MQSVGDEAFDLRLSIIVAQSRLFIYITPWTMHAGYSMHCFVCHQVVFCGYGTTPSSSRPGDGSNLPMLQALCVYVPHPYMRKSVSTTS